MADVLVYLVSSSVDFITVVHGTREHRGEDKTGIANDRPELRKSFEGNEDAKVHTRN